MPRSSCLETQPDGVWIVELANVDDPADRHRDRRRGTIGIGAAAGTRVEETLTDAIGDRRMTPRARQLRARRRRGGELACPRRSCRRARSVTLIATSREPLGIAGEQLLVSRRFPGASGRAAGSGEVAESDSVQLFVERTPVAHRHDFVLTSGNASAVADVCRRLDGLPLALELAAAQTRSFSVSEIASVLDERFVLLSGTGRGRPEQRQQTLRALVDWSWESPRRPAARVPRTTVGVHRWVDARRRRPRSPDARVGSGEHRGALALAGRQEPRRDRRRQVKRRLATPCSRRSAPTQPRSARPTAPRPSTRHRRRICGTSSRWRSKPHLISRSPTRAPGSNGSTTTPPTSTRPSPTAYGTTRGQGCVSSPHSITTGGGAATPRP